MYTPPQKKSEKTDKSSAHHAALQQKSHFKSSDFVDNRPEAIAQRKLQAAADQFTQENTIQRKGNNSGLAKPLKAGIEQLSGIAMNDVKVHYNSSAPAQLNAHAFAQGNQIHISPGQERHLPHEAWHVVQQKQGRVKATTQLNAKVKINDDVQLEREADTMGAKAANLGTTTNKVSNLDNKNPKESIQLARVKPKSKAKPKKKKKKKSSMYMGLLFTGSPPVVSRVLLGSRPPSNSRSGQGDHIIAYTLLQHAMAAKVAGRSIPAAAAGLEELLDHASHNVKDAPTNRWWHNAAGHTIALLQSIDPTNEAVAKMRLNTAINDIAKLLNMMPGATKKNAKSTKGHGEDVTGLLKANKDRAKGKAIVGNPWVNILKLIDLKADPSLTKSPIKLEQKVYWLMTLITHTIPTLYSELEANFKATGSDANLTAATTNAYGPLLGMEIEGYIEDFLNA